MFNFIDIYSFISVSVCVGKGPGVLFWLGVCTAVKTVMSRDNTDERYNGSVFYRIRC